MASYNPPTEDLSQFNSGIFNAVSGDSSLTISQGDLRYLRFPIGQGAETLPSVSITGTANIDGATTMGSASVSGTTTMSDTITLNKASGQQEINCSAPTGLKIATTANTAPISFSVQSSGGVYGDILSIQANSNPRVTMNVTEFQLRGSTGQNSTLAMGSTGLNIRNVASVGSGGIILDTTGATGAGAITLKTKDGTPGITTGLLLTGSALTSATAGSSSGQHLCLTINGVLYKIALLNA
jgi:hypothetical protein